MEQLQATAAKLLGNACAFMHVSSQRRSIAGVYRLALSANSDTEAVTEIARSRPAAGGQVWPILAGLPREAQLAVYAIYAANFISRSIHSSRNPLLRIENKLQAWPHRFPMHLSYDMVGAHYWTKRNRNASLLLLKSIQRLWVRAHDEAVLGRYCNIRLESLKFAPMFPPVKNWEDCALFLSLMDGDQTLPQLMELWHSYHLEQRRLLEESRPTGEVAGKLHGSLMLIRLIDSAFYLREWSFVRELAGELEERYALAAGRQPSELRMFKSPIHRVRAMARYVDAQMDPDNATALLDECLTQLELYLKTLKRAEYLGTQEIAPCVLLPAAMLLRLDCPEKQFPFLSTIRLFPEVLAFDPEAYAKARSLADGRDLIRVDWDMVVEELRRQPFKPGTEPSVSSEEWIRKKYADAGVPFPLDAK